MNSARQYEAGVALMLAHEQSGGDGWWKGWEMVKAAYSSGRTYQPDPVAIEKATRVIYEAMRYAADPIMPENVPGWEEADPSMRDVAVAAANQILAAE